MSRPAASASAGLDAREAPAATRSSARLGVRFHTVTGCPAFSSVAAHGLTHRAEPEHADRGEFAGIAHRLLLISSKMRSKASSPCPAAI